jgi:hypothetical protein
MAIRNWRVALECDSLSGLKVLLNRFLLGNFVCPHAKFLFLFNYQKKNRNPVHDFEESALVLQNNLNISKDERD